MAAALLKFRMFGSNDGDPTLTVAKNNFSKFDVINIIHIILRSIVWTVDTDIFRFIRKISGFCQNFNFRPKFRFFDKISIFYQSFDYFPKFQLFSKISIFQQSFDFFAKISIFDQSSDFWQNFDFLRKFKFWIKIFHFCSLHFCEK